jgi:flagellar motor switch protein FliN/FliY
MSNPEKKSQISQEEIDRVTAGIAAGIPIGDMPIGDEPISDESVIEMSIPEPEPMIIPEIPIKVGTQIAAEPVSQVTSSAVKSVRFAPLPQAPASMEQGSMDLLLDVDLDMSVELGRTSVPVREVLQLGPGSILELDKLAGEPVDIMVNGKLIARGEVVVVDENFGVRVTEIASRSERLSGLS